MFDDFITTLDLGAFSDEEKKLMVERKIDFRKMLSKTLKESRNSAKLDKCYYCGNDCSSFCNSHSVPAFCLKRIAQSGEVLYLNSLIESPLMDVAKGINEAGTFHIICRKCDSTIFSDYETPENYSKIPTPKMIAQIAMKNNLKFISKRLLEEKNV